MDKQRSALAITVAACAAMLAACPLLGQFGGGQGGAKGGPGGAKGAPAANLPAEPTAVKLPAMEGPITGPGPMYDSAPSQWPGRDVNFYNYETIEYFVSGTANGKPYKTRMTIRKPKDNAKFSGLVLAESMHPAGFAHGFEYHSVYIMSSGHATVEILTSGPALQQAMNPERYQSLQMSGDQVNEILAQVGALARSAQGPFAPLQVRKMILFGTSASSAVLVNYLPAHRVFRTPEMRHIYDGFLPTSNGAVIPAVDVPLIQVPTQQEYENIATSRQDGDEPGNQYRNYEFAGMGHLDSRNNQRLKPGDCTQPLSSFPTEAYMSVALHHLLRWVDQGIVPPRADRILIDRNAHNDGSLMALDEHGNPRGGIRTPYLDVPVAKYTARNPVTPGGNNALLCSLSVYTTPFSPAKLRQLYKTKANYLKQFEARLNELEKAGWSLPVYHDLIMADARKVEF